MIGAIILRLFERICIELGWAKTKTKQDLNNSEEKPGVFQGNLLEIGIRTTLISTVPCNYELQHSYAKRDECNIDEFPCRRTDEKRPLFLPWVTLVPIYEWYTVLMHTSLEI